MNLWLVLFSHFGTRAGGRNGEANAAVGVMGMAPAPIALMPRHSAADRPANEASAETMSASHPFAAAVISRSQLSVLALVIRVRSRTVSAGLVLFAGCRTFLMSPARGAVGIPRAAAL